MSRSRDTIFQSLGLEGLKASVSAPQSLGKWASLGHISNPSVKIHSNFKFLTVKKQKTNPFLFKPRVLKVIR